MKIIIDAFGGDNAPLAVLKGSEQAINEDSSLEILLCGKSETINKCAAENGISLNRMKIIDCPDIFDMHDEPNEIIKSKSNTSLAVGLKALANGEGDAFLSAGSTGAVLFGATFIVKRIKGVKRPAIGAVMPTFSVPYMVIDSGANINVRPEILLQFAMIGSVYMNKVFGIEKPRIGLLNNGVEETKGGDMLVETYRLLKKSNLNFIGNIEARDIPSGVCDVLVTDGFSGNIVLKLTEGVAMSFVDMIKGIFKKNIFTKIAALLVMPGIKGMKKKLDYTEYGGAPLLGISKPVIKAHGSSNAKAFYSAIKQAKLCAQGNMAEEIAGMLKEGNAENV